MTADSNAQLPSDAPAPPAAPQATEVADTLAGKFGELADQWHEETGFLSSPSQIAMHCAYQRIIGMGPRAIPLILEDLRERGGQWYWALGAITGESPVPPEASGNARRVKDAWLQWGRDHGQIR